MNPNIVNPNQALWEKGDFTEIAAFMRQSGEAIIQSIGITPPLLVLDLGCGDGTTAIPLARLGAEVVGIDIARNLVEAGNRRAAAAGLTRLKVQEGDACNLEGVADGSFDLVSCPSHNVIDSGSSYHHETESEGVVFDGRATERVEQVGGVSHSARRRCFPSSADSGARRGTDLQPDYGLSGNHSPNDFTLEAEV